MFPLLAKKSTLRQSAKVKFVPSPYHPLIYASANSMLHIKLVKLPVKSTEC